MNAAVKTKILTLLGCELERCTSVLCAQSKLWLKALAIQIHVEGGAKMIVKECGKSRKSAIKRFKALHNNSR